MRRRIAGLAALLMLFVLASAVAASAADSDRRFHHRWRDDGHRNRPAVNVGWWGTTTLLPIWGAAPFPYRGHVPGWYRGHGGYAHERWEERRHAYWYPWGWSRHGRPAPSAGFYDGGYIPRRWVPGMNTPSGYQPGYWESAPPREYREAP
jgi:hypothetical protein